MEKQQFEKFELIYRRFVPFVMTKTSPDFWQEEKNFSPDERTFKEQALTLICAFNRTLSGKLHPQYEQAFEHLNKPQSNLLLNDLAQFLRRGIREIKKEIEIALKQDAAFRERTDRVFERLKTADDELTDLQKIELFWQIFFPEGVGILKNKVKAEASLRRKRTVQICEKTKRPVLNPAKEILFTSNVLLTIPLKSWDIAALPVSEHIKQILMEHRNDAQKYWYDHPIPVGIAPGKNEVLYGLRGLDAMMAFEKDRGTVEPQQKLNVVLSCSVTHPFLENIAKEYLQETIKRSGGFEHLQVYLFTEEDVRHLVRLLVLEDTNKTDLNVLGVNGPYGRHYSFLKAIAAIWHVFIDPQIKATFKIDLDQVFDEERLLAETGLSALVHFKTDLWNARGVDSAGKPIRLGMIAGALVNADDIQRSLFTPDVPYSSQPQAADEFVFFSRLPQALSTQAEMMSKYDSPDLNGQDSCLQRVHVTGGTNGILVEALLDFKPFTPSFIGRAEDQAYLLSTMQGQKLQLGYLHKAGLIMRHDKERFAQEAIQAAEIGKMIGDYERILYFSGYARVLADDYRAIKDRVDPFTGCFISAIPKTVVYLRFVFKLLDLLYHDRLDKAQEFLNIGLQRIPQAMTFSSGSPSPLSIQYGHERRQWDDFYQMLKESKQNLSFTNKGAMERQEKIKEMIRRLQIA